MRARGPGQGVGGPRAARSRGATSVRTPRGSAGRQREPETRPAIRSRGRRDRPRRWYEWGPAACREADCLAPPAGCSSGCAPEGTPGVGMCFVVTADRENGPATGRTPPTPSRRRGGRERRRDDGRSTAGSGTRAREGSRPGSTASLRTAWDPDRREDATAVEGSSNPSCRGGTGPPAGVDPAADGAGSGDRNTVPRGGAQKYT